MKFLLLALCLGVALACPDRKGDYEGLPPRIQEISYRPGREYLYQYDSQVMTGLSQTSQIQAGFRISCLARVQFHTRSKVRVVFEKMVFYRINEPVVQWKATESLLPEEFLKELNGDEAATMEYFLQIPFGFEYDDGQVLRILLEDTETSWSANIKRGFTSLFEMNLERRFLLDEPYLTTKSGTPTHANLYKVFERSTTGDCATLYTVTPNAKNDHLYVTKTRNYNRCLNRPVYINSMWDGVMVEDAEKDNPLLNGATLKYNVRGNDRKFLILSVVGEGHIAFTPYKNQEQVRTSLNQTLYLKDSRQIGCDAQEIPEVHHGKHKKDTLRMTLPSNPVDCQDPFMPCDEEPKQINRKADVYSVDKIYLHLEMAARNTHEITSEESIQHLRTVKDMLTTSPEPIIKKLWEKVYKPMVNSQPDIERITTQILWNVLPSVGTEAAANVVLDICARDLLMTNNCTVAIRNLVLKVTPTTEIINKLIKLTKIDRLSKEVKQASYLSLGSYGYKLTRHLERHTRHCQQAQKMIDTLLKDNKARIGSIKAERKQLVNRCNAIHSKFQQIEEKIIRTLKKLSQSPKQEDEILALKSLGNSGLPGAQPILRKYLENKDETYILRIMAIIAYRRFEYPEVSRQEAIETLLKLYLTTTEKSEMRQFAFLVMFSLKPEMSVYETIGISLRQEKDVQLSGFVYSCLNAYANVTFRPDWEFKRNMTSALKFAPIVETGLEQSFLKRFGLFSEDYKRGAAVSLTSIGDMTGYGGAAINVDTYNYGLESNLLEFGVNTEGMSPFLNKLFGPRGLLTNNKSLFDLLKRGRRDTSPQEAINQIFKTLRLKERDMPTPYGHIYYNVMGHELGYWDFTQLLRTVTTTGLYPITWDEEGLRTGLPVDINTMYDISDFQLTLPTETGMPVTLRAQAMSSVKIEGSLTFKVTPYLLESDRQGQPPVAIKTKIDLRPKLAVELQCSMGLDTFYVKPIVGYRGLVKYNTPIQKELNIDLTYKRLNLKWINPVMEKPALEMILEPFSEFILISKKDESPVFILQRRDIYTPVGTRVLPISKTYNINALGYKLHMTGQLPHCVSKTNPIRPLNGRSLINIFWRPMENAPSEFTLNAQLLCPIREADANTLPHTEKMLPHSDPVDIQDKPIKMPQMFNKFERIFNKPMPLYNQEDARALILVLDASNKNIKRQMQLESLWNYLDFKNGLVGHMFTRMWRSPIPDYDTEEWQMLSEMGYSYPFRTMKPKDIFDPDMQITLMKDLERLISQDSHKVMNQGINMTILSIMEQLNYPAMTNAPTFRVLRGLVPEYLYSLKKEYGDHIYKRDWDSYWHDVRPVYQQVKEDLRTNVDRSYMKRDLPMLEQLTQILRTQERFINDLNDILSKNVVAHTEIPVIQWINFFQTKVVHMLREIFNKEVVMDRLHDNDKILATLVKAEANVDSILPLMHRVMQRVNLVSSMKQQDVSKQNYDPYTTYQETNIRDVYEDLSSYESMPEDVKENQRTKQRPVNNLRMALRQFSLKQMEFIESVQESISKSRKLDFKQWTEILDHTEQVLNIFDHELKMRPINQPYIKQSMLLVTIQNEFIIEMCEQWKRMVNAKLKLENIANTYSFNAMLMKERGRFLGERVALLFQAELKQKIVVPQLDQERPIYRVLDQIKRNLIPGHREFEIYVKYNWTNMQDPKTLFSYVDMYIENINNQVDKMVMVEKALTELQNVPKLYVLVDVMCGLHYMKFSTELAIRSLYSVDNDRRFAYLEKLYETSTKIEGLISNLSPIFAKYERYDMIDKKDQELIVNTIPIENLVLQLEAIKVKQVTLIQQVKRSLKNSAISSADLSNVLKNAVDRYEIFQDTLKENKLVETIDLFRDYKHSNERYIPRLMARVLNCQRELLELIMDAYKTKRAYLQDVRNTNRLNLLMNELSEIETRYKDSMVPQMINSMVEPLENVLDQPQNHVYVPKRPYLPNRVTALLNITWGNGKEPNKKASVQFKATRSVEQTVYLYKQLNAVWRSEDIVEEVNHRLSDKNFPAQRVMQKLNTFNHWHIIAEAQKEHLPEMLLNRFRYLQDFFKAAYWPQYKRQPATQVVTENQFQAMVDVSDLNKQFDLYVMNHAETNKYQGVRLWNWARNFPVIQTYKSLGKKMTSHLTLNRKPAECMVSKDFVYTFDDVNYKLLPKMNNKEALLAADCSHDKTFAVTMVRSNTTLGYVTKLINEDTIVEVSENLEVKVNGEIIKLEENTPVIYTKKLYYDQFETYLKIVLRPMRVEISFPLTGLQFVQKNNINPTLSKGDYLQLKVSEMFKGRMCGLCSNFDRQMSWEFEGPREEIYTSSGLFSQSYVLPEEHRHTYNPTMPEFTTHHDRYYDVVSKYEPREDTGNYL